MVDIATFRSPIPTLSPPKLYKCAHGHCPEWRRLSCSSTVSIFRWFFSSTYPTTTYRTHPYYHVSSVFLFLECRCGFMFHRQYVSTKNSKGLRRGIAKTASESTTRLFLLYYSSRETFFNNNISCKIEEIVRCDIPVAMRFSCTWRNNNKTERKIIIIIRNCYSGE